MTRTHTKTLRVLLPFLCAMSLAHAETTPSTDSSHGNTPSPSDQACTDAYRDSLIAAMERRDSVARATILHWQNESEINQAKVANWQQGWNELLDQHKTCSQALRLAITAANEQPPPSSPLAPKVIGAVGGFLTGFAAAWLIFGW